MVGTIFMFTFFRLWQNAWHIESAKYIFDDSGKMNKGASLGQEQASHRVTLCVPTPVEVTLRSGSSVCRTV